MSRPWSENTGSHDAATATVTSGLLRSLTYKNTHTAVSAGRKRLGGRREEHYNLLNEGKTEKKKIKIRSGCGRDWKINSWVCAVTKPNYTMRQQWGLTPSDYSESTCTWNPPSVCLCMFVLENLDTEDSCAITKENRNQQRGQYKGVVVCVRVHTWYTHSCLGTWPPMWCTCANTTWFTVAPHDL